MSVTSPCKKNGVNCEKRTPTCHSTCKEFAEFKVAKEAENEFLRNQKREEAFQRRDERRRKRF